MNDVSPLRESQAFWDREATQRTHTSWLEDPTISLYALQQIDPINAEWPVDWFTLWLKGRRFRRGLSIGCGTGEFERDLARHKLCDRIDAFDASFRSVLFASQSAKAGGHKQLTYFVADFNECRLPRRTYDIVFFHQSLHHVENLEGLLDEVLDSLTSGGMVYLDEYIGPSRSSWSDRRLTPHRAAFAELPGDVKAEPELAQPIQQDDPSEAIRSEEILEALRVGFRFAAFRAYGGNILSVVYPKLRKEKINDAILARLIELDRDQVAHDRHSYYAVVVAKPKRGIRKFLAKRRYKKLERRRVMMIEREGGKPGS
jgi:SAM-dependent methyltransferase